MLDDYKDTQKTAYGILSNAINNNIISHAYLIETLGNKRGFDFALSFAKALLCPEGKTNNKNCALFAFVFNPAKTFNLFNKRFNFLFIPYKIKKVVQICTT